MHFEVTLSFIRYTVNLITDAAYDAHQRQLEVCC